MKNDANNIMPFNRSHFVGQGWQIDAMYRHQSIPDYQGNPWIESLPPILTKRQAVKLLGLFPKHEESHRQASNEERFHLIQSGLKFFTPLPIHHDIERRISCLIRGGYASRNPLKPVYWENIEAAWEAMASGQFHNSQTWSTSAGMTMIGMSGMGKTTTTERILNTYPQVIHHGFYKGQSFAKDQVVWIKLECPYDGEPKSVCINFFQWLDKILGEHYCEDFGKDSRTAKVMLPDMANLAGIHGLGLLAVDEIQRLSHSRSGGAGKLLDFFGQMINTIGVPCLFIGTHKAKSILTKEVRQIRRGTGQGDVIWNLMKEDKIWRHFVESLWKYQYTRQSCPLTDELSEALYSETQGITDFAVKVYMLAQIRAITSRKEVVDKDIIESVAQDSLQTAAPVLKALRDKDTRVLAQYEDIPPIDFEDIVRREINPGAYSLKTEANNYSASSGKREERANDVSQHRATDPQAAITSNQSTQEATAKTKPGKTTRRRVSPVRRPPKGHLPKVVAELEAQHGISPYEALLQAGFIRHSNEYL